jgi:hypothetical protein
MSIGCLRTPSKTRGGVPRSLRSTGTTVTLNARRRLQRVRPFPWLAAVAGKHYHRIKPPVAETPATYSPIPGQASRQ